MRSSAALIHHKLMHMNREMSPGQDIVCSTTKRELSSPLKILLSLIFTQSLKQGVVSYKWSLTQPNPEKGSIQRSLRMLVGNLFEPHRSLKTPGLRSSTGLSNRY